MKKEEPILEIKNIKKSFFVGKKRVDVLKGVNLKVNRGEFVIIIGPSGCGKSTLLNVILGLERPDEGEVNVFGKSVYSIPPEERPTFRLRNFGAIYQQPNWIKSLNVIENVAFPLSLIGLSKKKAFEKAKSILYLFKTDKFEKYNPMELSGGEQQKLCVCRALITNPPIILADEPTGNLDSVTAEDLMYDLKLLNGESKKTFVMVTHNPAYERYATKFVYMEDGVIKSVKEKERVVLDTLRPQENITLERKKLFSAKLLFFTKLAIKNFKRYKMRTLLTSGGVALSIGFITFLVSLSYGFQKLTTEGIRNMEAFQMLDVETGKSKIVSIDEENINKIENIFGVEQVYPLLSLAGYFGPESKGTNGIVYGRSLEAFKIEMPRIIAGQSFSSENADEIILNTLAANKLASLGQGALGKEIDVSMVIRPELLGTNEKTFKTAKTKYKVVGVVDEGSAPYAYVPLDTLKNLGIVNYSEAKVKTTTTENVDRIKLLIEYNGFKVGSIKDTVEQANQFFGVFRFILIIFGVIAVSVSCIGMFNTLTISLVEKTREIGIMKSMGATRKDVKWIFILEALFVGIIGGLTGVVFSYLMGGFFNTSIYALAKTTGNVPVKIFVFTPGLFFLALSLSVVISILTGAYPARRASRISALDALRYE